MPFSVEINNESEPAVSRQRDLQRVFEHSKNTHRLSMAIAAGLRVCSDTDDPTVKSDTKYLVHCYFSALYQHITGGWHQYAARSNHPEFFYRLVPTFYELYRKSVVLRLQDHTGNRRTEYWDAYFRASKRARQNSVVAAWHILYLGVRAHIVGDLPEAILQASLASNIDFRDDKKRRKLKQEFLSRDSSQVFMEATVRFLGDLETQKPFSDKKTRGGLALISDRALSSFFVLRVQHWRRVAWRRACKIADADLNDYAQHN